MPEREAKLVITGERPEAVADEIAAMPTLADHRLIPASAVVLRDVYLDTPMGALRARRDALRVRIADGRAFLTFKGSGREVEVESGIVERDELELPWSEAAYLRLVDILAERGLSVRRAPTGGDPVSALLTSGLAPIQERETRRRLRPVEGTDVPIAELAIDEVTYRLDAGSIRHHEVEIEAKAPEGAPYLLRAVAELRARFGAALLPWRYGKLATGLAAERLLASGRARAVLADGHLTAAAYPELAEMLSCEPLPPFRRTTL